MHDSYQKHPEGRFQCTISRPFRFDYEGMWTYSNNFGDSCADYKGVAHLDDVRYLMK